MLEADENGASTPMTNLPVEVIDADSEETWPPALLATLLKHAPEVAAYQDLRAQIDRAAEADVMLRIDRPSNPHRPIWDEVLSAAEDAVAGRHLLGFHATRLTPNERTDVRKNGLQVLSEKLLLDRLAALLLAGDLPDALAAHLSSRHQAREKNRAGKLWFSFNREVLRDESSIERLFRSWGGEALYNSHEDHAEHGPALTAIGQPCIVVAAVPADGLETFMSVGERLLNIWCATRGIRTEHGSGFEGYTRADIPPAQILKTISFDDTDFLGLTAHGEWRTPLS